MLGTLPTLEDVRRDFAARSLSLSGERRAVLKALMDAPGPMDVESLWRQAISTGEQLSRCTVHRAMSLFHELEIVEIAAHRKRRRYFQLRRLKRTLTLVASGESQVVQIDADAAIEALEAVLAKAGYELADGVYLRVRPVQASLKA